MKISVDEDRELLLEEVYSGVGFRTNDGETLGVCMRDSGFEINYNGQWFSLQKGKITPFTSEARRFLETKECEFER